jgi:hypothetical protein
MCFIDIKNIQDTSELHDVETAPPRPCGDPWIIGAKKKLQQDQ